MFQVAKHAFVLTPLLSETGNELRSKQCTTFESNNCFYLGLCKHQFRCPTKQSFASEGHRDTSVPPSILQTGQATSPHKMSGLVSSDPWMQHINNLFALIVFQMLACLIPFLRSQQVTGSRIWLRGKGSRSPLRLRSFAKIRRRSPATKSLT